MLHIVHGTLDFMVISMENKKEKEEKKDKERKVFLEMLVARTPEIEPETPQPKKKKKE